MADAHANLAVSLVATAPSPASSGTSCVVTAAQGARFPAVPFNATIWPVSVAPTPTNAEIVRVTARTTDTLTITRAQESTSARTVIVGDQIAATITAKTLTDIETTTQPLDATLTALAGVTVAADKLIYATGADTFATTDLTATGRSILDDSSVGAVLTTLGVDSNDPVQHGTLGLGAAVDASNPILKTAFTSSITTGIVAPYLFSDARTFTQDQSSGTHSAVHILALPLLNSGVDLTGTAQIVGLNIVGAPSMVSGSGTAADVVGLRMHWDAGGNVVTASLVGANFHTGMLGSAGQVTLGIGVNIDHSNDLLGGGGFTTGVGLRINTSLATTDWGIQNGGDLNQFIGKLGIGASAITVAPVARLDVVSTAPNGTWNEIGRRLTGVATSDDVVVSEYTARHVTTTGTGSALWATTNAANEVWAYEAHIWARRTGGSAGAAEDSAYYVLRFAVSNQAQTGADTLTSPIEDVAGWTVGSSHAYGISSVIVTGATNTNITWHGYIKAFGPLNA